VREKAAPVDRIAHLASPIGDPARKRRIEIAYRAYVLKALRFFDLEGKAESAPQPRPPLLPRSDADNHAASDGVHQPDTRGSRGPSES
jgi:hypothetical protein